MVMLSKDHWHSAISDECKSCGESRMLTPRKSMMIMHNFLENVCLSVIQMIACSASSASYHGASKD